MSWHCSRALVAEFSAASCSDGKPSAPSKLNPTAAVCSCSDKTTECSIHSQFGMTCEHSTESRGVESWMSSLRDFRANHLARQAAAVEVPTHATAGRTPFASLEKSGQSESFWRTSPLCGILLGKSNKHLRHPTSGEFWGTWPRAGFVFGGSAFQLPSLARHTAETASGCMPTPTASDATAGMSPLDGRRGQRLIGAVRGQQYPTPRACSGKGSSGANRTEFYRRFYPTPKGSPSGPDFARASRTESGGDDLATAIAREDGGPLNPAWVEWLMGWPIGWTDLAPLDVDKFQQWLEQHGIS
jgi:hypothetical protein